MATRPPGTPVVAANGVSYAEFLRRKRANPKIKATWQGYTSYVKQKADAAAAQRAGTASQLFGQSYFQLNPAVEAQKFARLIPQDPSLGALSQAQLQNQARSMVMPLVSNQADEITKMIQQRSQRGMQAIQGYTNSYLNTLPAIQANIGKIYDEARGLQGAASGAFGDFIRNQGASLTNELAQAEQAAGQTSAGSQQVAQTAAGSSGATAAYDWSTMSRLIGEGAATKAWAAQLPGIAGAYSADWARQFQGGLNDTLQQQLSALNQSGQQNILSMYQTLLDRELQKAQLRGNRRDAIANYYGNIVGSNQDARLAGAAIMAQLQGQAIDNTAAYQQGVASAAAGAAANQTVPRGTQIQQAWAKVAPNIANAIAPIIQGQLGQPGIKNFNTLMNRILPMIRSQMGEWGLTEGQLRGFARQILAMQGIYPPKSAGKNTAPPIFSILNPGFPNAPAAPPVGPDNTEKTYPLFPLPIPAWSGLLG